MAKETLKRIRTVYAIVLSFAILLAGVCLIWACIDIYQTGNHPFSREAVAAHFAYIDIPVYFCLIMIVGSFVVDRLIPGDKPKRTVQKQYALMLQRLHDRTDLNQCGEDLRDAVIAQQKQRRLHRCIRNCLIVVCSVVFLCYGTNSANFHPSEINASMIRAMYVLLPCTVIPSAYAVFTTYQANSSIQKEIELLKKAPASAKISGKLEPASAAAGSRMQTLRCVILVIGIGILVYGFVTGGTQDVLTKAVNICTECVGLG